VSGTETIERPRTSGPGDDLGGNWRVIVLNDNHNTFEGVATALSRVIPGVSLDQGYQIADRIHNSGQAIVWTGQKEPAEHYWEQLKDAGLTMAPLERG
jgi:ATP-dependent Clp protease adaptor protein ClpS